MKYYIISDTHFFHDDMIHLCGRPQNFERRIIRNWRATVTDQDVVIHIGDVIFYQYDKLKEIMDSLPAMRKILVRGNHDKRSCNWYMRNGFDFACDEFLLNYMGKNLLFSHYPKNNITGKTTYVNIHGHSHLPSGLSDNYMQNDFCLLYSLEHEGYRPVELRSFVDQVTANKRKYYGRIEEAD